MVPFYLSSHKGSKTFNHHSKLTKRWAQLNPDLRVNRLCPDSLTIFPRKAKSEKKTEKEWKAAKTRRNRKPQQPSLLISILTPKPSSQSNSHSFYLLFFLTSVWQPRKSQSKLSSPGKINGSEAQRQTKTLSFAVTASSSHRRSLRFA